MSDTGWPPDGIRPPPSSGGADAMEGHGVADRAVASVFGTDGTPAGALGTTGSADWATDPLRAVRDYLRVCGLPGEGDDDNGAPALAASTLSGNVVDLTLAMQMMQASFSNAQAATSMAEIKINTVKLKASQAEQNAHYKKSVESARDAESKSGGILGFFKKLFKMIAAVAGIVLSALAVAASGGAAGPLLAFAVVGLVSASIGLASEISQAAGGPPISVSGMLTKMGTALAKACGATDEDAEKIGKVVGNSIGAPLCLIDPSVLGELTGGIAALSGADPLVIGIVSVVGTLLAVGLSFAVMPKFEGSETMNKIAAAAMKMTGLKQGLMVAKGLADGASGVVGGTQGVLVARSQWDADNARADAKASSVQTMKLQQQMDDLLDEVRKLFEQVEESYRGATQILSRASQSYQLLARNMGGRVGA